jgi:sortase srtA
MSHKKTKNKKSKKNKRRNLFINILAGFLILLSLALIFNSKIRDIFLVWNTNKYQVNQVTKENIDENLKTEGNFDFDSVSLFHLKLYWLHNGMLRNFLLLEVLLFPKWRLTSLFSKGWTM